jgi:fumarate reductase subunit D
VIKTSLQPLLLFGPPNGMLSTLALAVATASKVIIIIIIIIPSSHSINRVHSKVYFKFSAPAWPGFLLQLPQ